MFSGIISALGNVKNITYNDIYSIDIEITKINLEDFEKSDNLIKVKQTPEQAIEQPILIRFSAFSKFSKLIFVISISTE